MNTTTSRTCVYYFVHLDANGNPIPGTMYGKPNNNTIDGGYKCAEARVTGTVMQPGPGQVQCMGPFRYWYQINRQGNILPNSMIAVNGVPGGQAGRSCNYIEFKVFKPS